MKKIITLALIVGALASSAFAHHPSMNFDFVDTMISVTSPHLDMVFQDFNQSSYIHLTPSLKGNRYQTLEGVTGSGKTNTMAKVIENVKMPTIIMTVQSQ